jgi:dephospho-CoA kinase
MLKVGLTGGIGSGKSTVAHIFGVLGVPVYYADDAAKRLMEQDENLKEKISRFFGKNSYSGEKLNREYLASAVFNNEEKLAQLNKIVHPAVIADAQRWFNSQKALYVIKEAALIFESGSESELDYVIGVKAPYELRLQRAKDRDHITEAEVISRMSKQMDEQAKLERCDFIIVNDEVLPLIPQVLSLHEKLLKAVQNN